MSAGFLLGERQIMPWESQTLPFVLRQLLRGVAWNGLDYLVIDLPPGTADLQVEVFREASLDGALLVVGPQDVAHLDAKKVVTLLNDANVPLLGAVENMATTTCPHCGERIDLFPEVCDRAVALARRRPPARVDPARPGARPAQRRAAAGLLRARGRGRARARVKKRLDVVLVERGLAESRAQAQALVLAGLVQGYDKPGTPIDDAAELEVAATPPYVSRGGHKLANALDAFGIDVAGRDCCDVGASTGGFTDVLLQRGAARVIALDVGYGQLHPKLRDDPRVVVLERTNARHVTELPFAPELVTCDVSFISVGTALPPVLALAAPGWQALVLVKPQFEAGREEARKGVVRDPDVHHRVARAGRAGRRSSGRAETRGVVDSGLPGPKGNREFVLHLVHLRSRAVPTTSTAGSPTPLAWTGWPRGLRDAGERHDRRRDRARRRSRARLGRTARHDNPEHRRRARRRRDDAACVPRGLRRGCR